MNLNLFGKSVNNFSFVKQKKVGDADNASPQTPQMIDLATSPTSSSKPVIKVTDKKPEYKTAPIKDTSKVSLGRKNKAATQTPSEIVSEIAKQPISSATEFVDCQINISDITQKYIDAPIARKIQLSPDELEDLMMFVEEIEYKRHQQEKQEQEKRSWGVAQKIIEQEGGTEFLEQHNISYITSEDGEIEEWIQSLTVVKDSGESDEISQPLNFYGPQHNWILESWLSQQATSWTVRRYNQTDEQIIYQVSFGFPDQTFLEAEGPSREGAIMAVAEDLLN